MKICLFIIHCMLCMLRSETVVCSFEIIHDICAQICEGTNIELVTIVPKDSDPHLFQPKPSDSKKIFKASLVIMNGLGLEGWIEGIIKASGYNGEIVQASAAVVPRILGKLPDPHIWHDPELVIIMVENIRNALLKKFPNTSQRITENATRMVEDLRALDKKIKDIFTNLPAAKKMLLTTHDAFSYFAKRYGIIVYSPQGISTGDDPSAADLSNLVKKIRQYNINAIFLEKLANPKIIKIIAQETNKEVKGSLYADTLAKGRNLQGTILLNAQAIAAEMIE